MTEPMTEFFQELGSLGQEPLLGEGNWRRSLRSGRRPKIKHWLVDMRCGRPTRGTTPSAIP